MRKLSHACKDAQAHHALAIAAITKIGETKGFRDSAGLENEVYDFGDGPRVSAGAYAALPPRNERVFISTHANAGCTIRWEFTWPGLKLLKFAITSCDCIGVRPEPYDL